MVNGDLKQKNIFLYIAVLIIFIVNVYLIYNNRQVKIESEALIAYLNQKEEEYRSSYLRDFEINSTIISLNINKHEAYASNNKYVFVYSFPEFDCEKCIVDNIDLLKENILELNIDVVIFPVVEMSRNAKLKMKAILHGLEYILLEKNEAILPMISGNEVGFFAILTQDGELVNIFIPDGAFPEKTKYYFDYIKKRYF